MSTPPWPIGPWYSPEAVQQGEPNYYPAPPPWSPPPPRSPAAATGGQRYYPDPAASPAGTSRSRRSGLLVGLLIGLVLALGTGAGGYVMGSRAAPQPAPRPTPSPSLGGYETSQAALNRIKLDPGFGTLAEPLLPWMGACTADTDPGGVKLPADESRHVFCRYGGTTVHFSLYTSNALRNTQRGYREQAMATTEALAPGAGQPGPRKGAVSGASGDYVEFAWKGDDGRAWCGIWWDREDLPLAGLRFEALCQEGLGGSWDPLRDLWRRYS